MATVVDICNLALNALGDRATLTSIDPPEGSVQAEKCAAFWPIARDEALADYDWSFASTWDDTITALDIEHPVYQYVYTLPVDCLVVRELRLPDGASLLFSAVSPQFEMSTIEDGTPVLLTNYSTIALRYSRRVNVPSRYSPGFVSAVIYLLASKLAGSIIKGKAGVQTAQAMMVAYQSMSSKAATVSANQDSGRRDFVPSALRARGYGYDAGRIVSIGQERYSLPFWAQ